MFDRSARRINSLVTCIFQYLCLRYEHGSIWLVEPVPISVALRGESYVVVCGAEGAVIRT